MNEIAMDPTKKLSLTWEAYENSICKGLGLLQQNGEFVDMTLAADGHHVKVHQMVLSLVSPFVKDLIRSAGCPHPVIFLNKVSYDTLQSILEYAYTGEVLVAPENVDEFLQACKDLHIKGLQDFSVQSDDDGEDLLQLIDEKNNDNSHEALQTSLPEHHSQIPSKKTSLQTGIKRRRTAKIKVEYLDYEMNDKYHDDIQNDNDNAPYYDGDESHDKCDIITDIVENSNRTKEDVEEIEPYRAGSRWFRRDEYYYVICRTKGQTVYLRCGSEKCPAHWSMSERKGVGPVVDIHNHNPTPWVPDRNAMFQALKRRTKSDCLSLHAIYLEEAKRYPQAALHLPFESVAPSMRKWRSAAKLIASRELQALG